MLTGLLAGDAATIQRLCGGSMRIFLRIGQLLTNKIAFTQAALEQLVATNEGQALLLLPTFAENPQAQLDKSPGLVLVEPPACPAGWRVVAIIDEVDNPLLQALAPPVPAVARIDGFEDLAPALRGPVEVLLTAEGDEARASALDRLRYAGAPLEVVAKLMPLLMADGAGLVRERTFALCAAAGARAGTLDAMRALAGLDGRSLTRAMEVLPHEVGQVDLLVAMILAQLDQGQDPPGLLPAMTRIAGFLVQHPALERLLDRMLARRQPIVEWIRAMQEIDAQRVHHFLYRQLGRGLASDAQIIALLAGSQGVVADAEELLRRGVELLVEPGDQPPERQTLAAALRRIAPDRRLIDELVRVAPRIPLAGDSAVLWLMADRLRAGITLDEATGLALSTAVTACLGKAGSTRIAALEQQVAAELPPGPARASLVGPLLETVAGTRDERTRDLVTTNLIRMGADAAPALWEIVAGHPELNVRCLALSVLPRILSSDDAMSHARRLLRRMQVISETRERVAVVEASAEILVNVDHPDVKELSEEIAGLSGALGWQGCGAAGWCAAGLGCPGPLRQALLQRLLIMLEAEPPADKASEGIDPATGDPLWILDQRLADHTASVPMAINALVRALSVPWTGEPSERNSAVDRLRTVWRNVSSMNVIWGPAAVLDLGQGLAKLAGVGSMPVALRLRILDSLMPGIEQPGLAIAMVKAVMTPGGSFIAQAAGRLTARLLRRTSESDMPEEDWVALLPALVLLLTIPDLGPESANLHQRLGYTISAQRERLTLLDRTLIRQAQLTPEIRSRLVNL